MPTIIGQQDNSMMDALGSLFQLPAQIKGQRMAQEQQNQKNQLANQVGQSRIAANNSTAAYNAARTGAVNNQQAALMSPELQASLASLFTPDPETGKINPLKMEALVQANPKMVGAGLAALMDQVQSGNMLGQVATQQDPKTATGQANLAAMGAGKALPMAYSDNANGSVLNQITGGQAAPTAPVQNAILAQKQAGRSSGRASQPKEMVDTSKKLMGYLKSPALDEEGNPQIDLNTNQPVMVMDRAKANHYAQYRALPENAGIDERQVAQKYMMLMDQQEGNNVKLSGLFAPQQKPQQPSQGGNVGSNPPQQGQAPVKIADKAQYDSLPPGTQYIDPNGQLRVKK